MADLKVKSKKYNDKDVLEVENLSDEVIKEVNAGIQSGDIPIPSVEVGDIIVTEALASGGSQGEQFYAFLAKTLTEEEFDKIPQNGLAIIMFNTTCVIIPFTKQEGLTTFNRFVCNAIYSPFGDSMVARAVLQIQDSETKDLYIRFDENFAEAVSHFNDKITPYAIIRFIGL